MLKHLLLILSLMFTAAIMQGQVVHYFSCVQVQGEWRCAFELGTGSATG